jgi:phosphoserine aminotransferase
LEITHRQKKKINRLKNKKDKLVNTRKIPSIYRKQITHLQSGNQTHMELRSRTVGLLQQVQHSHHADIPIQILRAIANAPRYVTNHTLHTDFNNPYVSDVIHEGLNKHHIKLEVHPNPLLEPLLQPVNNIRLKRCWPFDLQGT